MNRTSLYEPSSIRDIPCHLLTNSVTFWEMVNWILFTQYPETWEDTPFERSAEQYSQVRRSQMRFTGFLGQGACVDMGLSLNRQCGFASFENLSAICINLVAVELIMSLLSSCFSLLLFASLCFSLLLCCFSVASH